MGCGLRSVAAVGYGGHPVRRVIDLAGPVDIAANVPGYEALCRDSVIASMLGRTRAAVPERYAQASAMKLPALGIPLQIDVRR